MAHVVLYCPECGRVYTTGDEFKFCLEDGSQLYWTEPTTLLTPEGVLKVLTRKGRDKHIQYVLFGDLDGFTLINNIHGREVGNAVLEQVEIIINGHFAKDMTFRVKGDQFIIILNRGSELEALALAEECRQKIKTFDWSSIVPGLYVDSSWGEACLTSYESVDKCLLRAIYGAEAAKKGTFRVTPSGEKRQVKVVKGPKDLPRHVSRDVHHYFS